MKKRLVTSALPYVNNIPHLGNLIQVLSADVFARFCRQSGYETLYICGSDEYGTATETRALQENIHPKELCDRFYRIHKDIYDWFHIEFDHFGRTSCPEQTEIVQSIYRAVAANGFVQKREMEQTYCSHCQRFLADRYVSGQCPHCGDKNARGDQCENCSTMLDPTDLLEPRCGTCGATPEYRNTEHLFIDLPALKEQLEAWIDQASSKGRWAKNALQMTKSWIRDGLKQRCITRDLSWGVPVPDLPGKVFYVWFDAPIGYISITAELLKQRGEDWRSWWQNPDEVELFQFIGKDNIPFHTVLFPSSLLASCQVAKKTFDGAVETPKWTMLHHMSSSEYLNYESGKFSKTRGVGIFGNDCQDTGIPADCWRFYLYYNRPEKGDYEFTWTEFQQLLNRELIGNLGNFVNRTLSFLQRFFQGQLLPSAEVLSRAELTAFCKNLHHFQAEIRDKLEWGQVKEGLRLILDMAAYGNKIFQEKEPWALVKRDHARAHAWLCGLVYLIHDLAICLCPYLPQTAAQIADFLDLPPDSPGPPERFSWQRLGAYQRLPLNPLPKPQILFQALEDEKVAELRRYFSGSQSERGADPAKQSKLRDGYNQYQQEDPQDSSVRDFVQKIDLCVGRIIQIEPHPNAERLFVEQIDCGEEAPRTVVSGLGGHYQPAELLGKTVVLVANLKPAKLRGIKSMGMILAASPAKGTEEAARNAGLPLVEVLHPPGEPGDRIVVQGFETEPRPSRRASINDFFAASLFLHQTRVYLLDSHQNPTGLPLLLQSSQNAQGTTANGLALQSIALQNGIIS